jgi:rare lipoprotein A
MGNPLGKNNMRAHHYRVKLHIPACLKGKTNRPLISGDTLTLGCILFSIMFLSWNCASGRYADRTVARHKKKTTASSKQANAEESFSVKKYFENVGEASYYADKYEGQMTSNGEVFSQDSLTAAHLTLPFDTRVRVTNLKNNKSVVVRINDRPPADFKRLIDLSYRAAKKLDMIADGIAEVKIEILK